MQGFGAQTHLFSEVTGPQQFERTKKKKCPMDLRKLLTLKTHTPQIWGVKISPPKFRKRPSKNTVKQVIFEVSPPKFGG